MPGNPDLVIAVEQLAYEEGDFTLKSGQKSDFYLDCRKLTLHSTGARLICQGLQRIIDTLDVHPDAMGGPSLGADPIVGAYLHYYERPRIYQTQRRKIPFRGFLVRPEPKDHGKGGRVVGPVKPGDRVVLVEDVTTTGESLLQAGQALQAEFKDVEIMCAISVVDRQAGALQLFGKHDIPFYSLVTLQEVLDRVAWVKRA